MFIPIDTAFNAALSYNPDLYSYAFDKNVVIVTSSTLLATLKTVDTMWKNVKQQKNAFQIAEEAGKMYDKFVGFSEDLMKISSEHFSSCVDLPPEVILGPCLSAPALYVVSGLLSVGLGSCLLGWIPAWVGRRFLWWSGGLSVSHGRRSCLWASVS